MVYGLQFIYFFIRSITPARPANLRAKYRTLLSPITSCSGALFKGTHKGSVIGQEGTVPPTILTEDLQCFK